MKSILLAIKAWWQGEEIWFFITSVNPVCYSPWWVMATTKTIIEPEKVVEFYRGFWSRRLK